MDPTMGLEAKVNKGTTTVGLTCSDGVVMATEKRATMGYLISHKNTQKLFRIDEHMGLTVAGLVGDAQALARWLTAEVSLYKTKRGQDMTVKAASTLLSNILNNAKFAPFYVQLVLGGVDRDGSHVYSLDAAGGNIPDDYVTTGSGSPYVYGVLEDSYKPGLSVSDGVDIAVRGLTAAMARDAGSGNGIQLCTITREKGYVQFAEDDLDKRRKKLKLA
jgi:proteasome beta subunit